MGRTEKEYNQVSDKDKAIRTLEKLLDNSCNNLDTDEEWAIQYAIGSMKKGSKSWKGYRRFKRKYIELNNCVQEYATTLLLADTEERDNKTWEGAMEIFYSYFKQSDSGEEEIE